MSDSPAVEALAQALGWQRPVGGPGEWLTTARTIAAAIRREAAAQLLAEANQHAVEYPEDQRFRDGLMHAWSGLRGLRSMSGDE